MSDRQKEIFIVAGIIFLSAFLFFFRLGEVGLFEPDEGRYAEIPREMCAENDFIVPRLNGVLYFEKPPLVYWMTSLSFALLGQSEFSARFSTALPGLVVVLLTYALARKMYGKRCAAFSALVLLASLEYFFIARLLVLDMPLTLFMTLGFASFYFYLFSEKAKKIWLFVFYFSLAMGVLTKGPVAFVLPAGVIFLFSLLTGNGRKAFLDKAHLAGLALFFAVASPWFFLVTWREPSFFRFFFIHEHLVRFLTSEHGRAEPFYYFFVILLVGFLPWVIYLVPSAMRYLKVFPASSLKKSENQPFFFLFLWAVMIVGFFSLSGSKLPAYILPIYPAMAIMAGKIMEDSSFDAAEAGKEARIVFASGALLMTLFAAYMVWVVFKKPVLRPLFTFVFVLGACLLGGWVLSAYLFFRRRKRIAAYLVQIMMMLFLETAFIGLFEKAEDFFSGKKVIMKLKEEKKQEDILYCYNSYVQAVPFYLKERVRIVNWRDELGFGAGKLEDDERKEWFIEADMDFVVQELGRSERVFFIMKKGDYKALIKNHPELSKKKLAEAHNTILMGNVYTVNKIKKSGDNEKNKARQNN
ncbi:MAG: glycosyltransferase family 39 protein [Candidatus Aureabacteria bacterium]|nr:glycosyltransferase family 39 protein [Candidatus Auribacterota bacterium]